MFSYQSRDFHGPEAKGGVTGPVATKFVPPPDLTNAEFQKARTDGRELTLAGTGRVGVTTPSAFEPGRSYTVGILPLTTERDPQTWAHTDDPGRGTPRKHVLAADERGRLRIDVALAAGLSAALAQAAGASPPQALSAKALAVATPELVPAPVAALSHGVLRIMFLDKLKSVALLAAITLGLAACVALASQPRVHAPDAPKLAPLVVVANGTEPVPVQAKPMPQGPNKILFYRAGHLVLIDPDGKNDKKNPPKKKPNKKK